MTNIDLFKLEQNLKKRIQHPHTPWKQKQNNKWDAFTNFIYKTRSWEQLNRTISTHCPLEIDPVYFSAYATNRWFNFWSAKGVEEIFCRLPDVQAAKNRRNRLVDFSIQNIKFDHKTSVFPKKFPYTLYYAHQYPHLLIKWLYKHQSQQQRHHLHNRLFIILYDSINKEHWKLRAELLWLETKIKAYVDQFNPKKLITIEFDNQHQALADIVWAIKK